MKKAKFLSILLVLSFILGLCAGCAQTAPATQPAKESPTQAAPTKAPDPTKAPEAQAAPTEAPATQAPAAAKATDLEIWSFVEGHLKFYQKMAGMWNEQNPDRQINLKPTYLDWAAMHDKLYTAMVAGEGVPDISDVEISKWPNFMNGEIQFLDLTKYIEPYKNDLVTNRLDIYSKDGKNYGAPSHIGATVMYYNVELLKEAGIDYTTIVNWDDFEKALKTYKEKTGKYMTYCETYGSYEFTVMLTEKGKDLIDDKGMPQLNSPEAVEVSKLIRKWVDADIIGFIPTGNADTPEGKAAVANGDVAALMYPLWYMSRFTDEMPDLSGKIAIAPLPVFDENSNKSVGLGGTGTIVYKNSKNAELAAEFITWAKLSEVGSTNLWTDLGFDPVNKLVSKNLEVTKDQGNKFLKYFVTNPFDVLAKVQDKMFTAKTMQNSGIINDYNSANTWNRIYVSKEDPAKVLDEAQKELMSQSK
jgi:arabinosaccharide transport system substrate-binding protein